MEKMENVEKWKLGNVVSNLAVPDIFGRVIFNQKSTLGIDRIWSLYLAT